VVGIRDQHLSKQLQMDPELTQEKAKTRICQKETINKQQDFLTISKKELTWKKFVCLVDLQSFTDTHPWDKILLLRTVDAVEKVNTQGIDVQLKLSPVAKEDT